MGDEKATRVRMIDVSKFKEKCLKLIEEVARSGHEIVITKNRRPVSRLLPYRKMPNSLFGIDRGRTEIIMKSSNLWTWNG